LTNGGSAGKRVLVIEDGPTLTHGEMAMVQRGGGTAISAQPRSSIHAPMRRFDQATMRNIPQPQCVTGDGYGDKQFVSLKDHQRSRLRPVLVARHRPDEVLKI